MATGTGDLPILRSYVPYGELQVNYDLLRRVMGYEIPMTEGCGWPYLRSPIMPGASGAWVYPGPIGNGPSWTCQRPAWDAGWPRGPNAIEVYAEANYKQRGGDGLVYFNVLDPVISQYVISTRFSFLFVGTPMAYMNPSLTGSSRGIGNRYLLLLRTPAGQGMHALVYRYSDDSLIWQEYAVAGSATPKIPYYGQRCSFLFVHGLAIGETSPRPRVFIGKEDGTFQRADFLDNPGSVPMMATAQLELFNRVPPNDYTGLSAGGCWEYAAYFVRAFSEPEACAICRDALGFERWDPYVVRRIGWTGRHQVGATPGSYGRVGARPRGWPVVVAVPSTFQRVSASARSTGQRVAAAPNSYQRISARIRIADKEADVQATPLCPSEINYDADNVLELADVVDELTDPPTPITSAISVECEVYDRSTGLELTTISPVTLSQVGSTNKWRGSVYATAANGFSINQRLQLIFVFDGGPNLRGRFEALAVVVSATS